MYIIVYGKTSRCFKHYTWYKDEVYLHKCDLGWIYNDSPNPTSFFFLFYSLGSRAWASIMLDMYSLLVLAMYLFYWPCQTCKYHITQNGVH